MVGKWVLLALFLAPQVPAATFLTPQIHWKALARGLWQPELPGARYLIQPGRPALPYLERRVEIPPGWRVEATLKVPVWETLAERPLFLVPAALSWSGSFDVPITPAHGVFPGRYFETETRKDGLYLTVYPLQYDAGRRELKKLSRAELVLDYTRVLDLPDAVDPFARESVIVTGKALAGAAEKLAVFQRETYGVPAEVVLFETLEPLLPETEYPDGAKSAEFRARELAAYDFQGARKIAAYLRRRMRDGVTRYVTILGDASVVPPSYYFAAREVGVTDACYFASDGCLKPQLALGRLPFRTEGEVARYLAKVRHWVDEAGKAESEAAFLGGRAFPGEVFLGQLGVMAALNREDSGWRGVEKLFLSRDRYSKEPVLDVLSSKKPSVVVYHLDHGKGNRLGLDEEHLSSDEIAATKAQGKFPPLVVSIACTNAAFDEEIPRKSPFEFPASGKQSVGVTLLKSDGGAVGYLGSLRPAIGTPVFQIDKNGNTDVIGATHAVDLLGGFVESYATSRGGRVGDLWLERQKRYAAKNDLKDRWNRWTFWNAAYLGDPLLRLPHRRGVAPQTALARSRIVFDAPKVFVLPRFWANLVPPKLVFEGNGKLGARLLKITDEARLLQSVEVKDRGQIELDASRSARFLLEVENLDGAPVERQIWFEVEKRED